MAKTWASAQRAIGRTTSGRSDPIVRRSYTPYSARKEGGGGQAAAYRYINRQRYIAQRREANIVAARNRTRAHYAALRRRALQQKRGAAMRDLRRSIPFGRARGRMAVAREPMFVGAGTALLNSLAQGRGIPMTLAKRIAQSVARGQLLEPAYVGMGSLSWPAIRKEMGISPLTPMPRVRLSSKLPEGVAGVAYGHSPRGVEIGPRYARRALGHGPGGLWDVLFGPTNDRKTSRARTILPHEFAHTQQAATRATRGHPWGAGGTPTGRAAVEGGADAFAYSAAPRVYRALGWHYDPRAARRGQTGTYSDYEWMFRNSFGRYDPRFTSQFRRIPRWPRSP